MSEQKIFEDYMNLTVNTFKEDVEKGLNHMKNLIQLSKPPFNKAKKDDKKYDTNKAMEDEDEYSRRF